MSPAERIAALRRAATRIGDCPASCEILDSAAALERGLLAGLLWPTSSS